MRLIDADELITAFPCGESIRTESVRATINNMPTIDIDRPQGWIPCSEKLPSEFSDDKRVLVTTDVDEMGVIIMPIYDVKSWYLKGYISAWQPLPKPWEGAEE